ncbi:dihydrolipoamide acetyltransferase family protein [Trichococcus flocculiformis]|uniref:dihydrolipoamide acetyltransferase family protein n=1 Tax=Trichococcus flocculiformis TaxID=82803 RepID=UPI002AABF365|nr:dihydrolipoamide acetyltransferase family protein [Trichococcus flocculiformis]
MAKEIVMPKLGLTMTEGTVDEWLVAVGDTVKQGDSIATISSEKLSSDVESPADGIILELMAKVGDTVPCKKPMAYIGEEGEAIDSAPSTNGDEEAVSEAEAKTTVADTTSTSKETLQASSSGGKEKDRIFITPIARRMAKEKGIDVSQLNGTGGNGRITRRDVERYTPTVAMPASQPMGALAKEEIGAGLTGMRKTIAQRLVRSLQTTAQVTEHRKADVTRLNEMRETIKKNVNRSLDGGQISWNTLVTKATILALRETPAMNAWYYDGKYEQLDEVHIGMATSVDDGLVVPVIKNAHQMTLTDLGKSIAEVSTQARQGNLPSNLYSGSTFTITNLGGRNIEYFTPILNTPEIGILGVGAIGKELALEAGEVVEKLKLPLSLTFDHQIIDGDPAAEFLDKIIAYLEDPYSLFL